MRKLLLPSVKIMSSCLIIAITTSIQPLRVNHILISKPS